MKLERFHTIEDFYTRAEPFLIEREAEHNVILGRCAYLMRYPHYAEEPPYLAVVEHEGRLVAAAFMGRSDKLVLSYIDAPSAIALLVEDLCGEYKELPGVVSSKPFGKAFAEEWGRKSGQPTELWMAQRIFQLERVIPVGGVPGNSRRATDADRELLANWLAAFNKEALGETDPTAPSRMADRFIGSDTHGIYLWEDPEPVSMCGYSRPTPNGICVLAVYTPPKYRGRGYASACVAALSQMLLDSGRKYCFLYTDLANPTSNRIYQAIGYEPVCDAEIYSFQGPTVATE